MKLPKHKYLLTYRSAEIVHDLTVLFCHRYLSDLSTLSNLGQRRTIDQMIQAARSTKQNIVEGVSQPTSLKGQIKLLGVAKASSEELTTDYEDFLRQRKLAIYPKNHPKISRFRQIKSLEKRFIQEGGYSENLFHKRLKILKSLKGFTLLESLIIIALLALILAAALVLLNPKKQLEKAWDSQRKSQLAKLQKIFEDYYNDNRAYPKNRDVCYDYDEVEKVDGNCFCHICGLSGENNFSPYLPRLFCDPQYPKKDYLYQYDCPDRQWYRLCATLSDSSHYAVASPNINPGQCAIVCPPDQEANKYCFQGENCNVCGYFQDCQKPSSCNQPLQLYKDSNCAIPCYQQP